LRDAAVTVGLEYTPKLAYALAYAKEAAND